jgi:hypothetical protein
MGIQSPAYAPSAQFREPTEQLGSEMFILLFTFWFHLMLGLTFAFSRCSSVRGDHFGPAAKSVRDLYHTTWIPDRFMRKFLQAQCAEARAVRELEFDEIGNRHWH